MLWELCVFFRVGAYSESLIDVMLRIFRVVGAVPSVGSKSDLVFNKRFCFVRESSCPGEWAHCLGLSPRFPRRLYRVIINCLWGSGAVVWGRATGKPISGVRI